MMLFALNEQGELDGEILKAVFSKFIPNKVVIWKWPNDPVIDKLLSIHADKRALNGEITLYLCTKEKCEPPLVGKEKILERMEKW